MTICRNQAEGGKSKLDVVLLISDSITSLFFVRIQPSSIQQRAVNHSTGIGQRGGWFIRGINEGVDTKNAANEIVTVQGVVREG